MPDLLPLFAPLLQSSKTIYFAYDLSAQRMDYLSEGPYEEIFGDPAAHIDEDLAPWLARIHPADYEYLRQLLEQAAPNELVQDVELRVTRANGHLGWFRVTAYRTGQHLCGTLRDISIEMENHLSAQKFNAKKNTTLEILSHDLAAPLIQVQQLADHLAREAQGQLTDRMQHLLTLMERTCRNGVDLIRDFVDNEFMESANVDLKPERADLVAWLRLIVREYQGSEWHTHLHFDLDAADETLYALFDIKKFEQVINNLVSNSIKFTPDGGHITVRVARQADAALISVTDTGVGIPEHYQAGLFERFTPARRPGLRGEKTTGLGMSLIQTIVHLHQGRIWFESAEGQGTTFFVELPALPA